jgi:hypothetical protein
MTNLYFMDRLLLESVYKVDILSPSPTHPLKGGAILLPSPLRGEGKGEGKGEGEGEGV